MSLIKSQEVAEGQDAKFVCELSGDRLDVAWHHNEKKVMPRDSKCELKRLGRRHTLYVRHCKAADAGEVSIKVGESTCRASLIVKCKNKNHLSFLILAFLYRFTTQFTMYGIFLPMLCIVVTLSNMYIVL